VGLLSIGDTEGKNQDHAFAAEDTSKLFYIAYLFQAANVITHAAVNVNSVS
jgi:hypothetical protein